MENFNGNSDAEKNTKKFEAVTNKVTVSNGIGAVQKVRNKFFAQDLKSVASNVLDKVIIPSLQKLLSDTFKQSLDWLIYGTKGTSNPYNSSTYGNVSYSKYYQQQQDQVPLWARPQQQQPSQNMPGPYAVNYVLFAERSDAEIVLERMQQAIATYGMVSVADFYDMVNQHCSFTDQKWGWTNLSGDVAYVIRNGDQFSIQFPQVRSLEQD